MSDFNFLYTVYSLHIKKGLQANVTKVLVMDPLVFVVYFFVPPPPF